jgi:hypothetical protein
MSVTHPTQYPALKTLIAEMKQSTTLNSLPMATKSLATNTTSSTVTAASHVTTTHTLMTPIAEMKQSTKLTSPAMVMTSIAKETAKMTIKTKITIGVLF